MLKQITKQVPIVGSAYGLVSTSIDVYNSTSIGGALKSAAKGIVTNCTPPEVKTPLLCSALVVNGIIYVASGFNPIAGSLFFNKNLVAF